MHGAAVIAQGLEGTDADTRSPTAATAPTSTRQHHRPHGEGLRNQPEGQRDSACEDMEPTRSVSFVIREHRHAWQTGITHGRR